MEVEKATRRLEAKAKEREKDGEKEDAAAQDAAEEMQTTKEVQELVEKRKAFLMEQIASRVGIFANYKWELVCCLYKSIALNYLFKSTTKNAYYLFSCM